jgi:excinuclease ABC subunit C
VPGAKDPVAIKPGTAALFLLQKIRDEAHRFAVSYHKNVRGKSYRRSSLEDVPGIGKKKAAALIKHLGGVAAVKKASLEELKKVPGISDRDAENLKENFNKEKPAGPES